MCTLRRTRGHTWCILARDSIVDTLAGPHRPCMLGVSAAVPSVPVKIPQCLSYSSLRSPCEFTVMVIPLCSGRTVKYGNFMSEWTQNMTCSKNPTLCLGHIGRLTTAFTDPCTWCHETETTIRHNAPHMVLCMFVFSETRRTASVSSSDPDQLGFSLHIVSNPWVLRTLLPSIVTVACA